MAVTAKTYVLSSHGGLISNNTFTLPSNVAVVFYCNDGHSLSDDIANQAWFYLTDGRGVNARIVETVTGGNIINNYNIWGGVEAQSFRRKCGLFLLKPGRQYDVVLDNDINTTLEDIVKNISSDSSPVTIHYLACRD